MVNARSVETAQQADGPRRGAQDLVADRARIERDGRAQIKPRQVAPVVQVLLPERLVQAEFLVVDRDQ